MLILFFCFFWIATQFNAVRIADDMKASNSYVPGIRPGNETRQYLHKVLSRITVLGAVALMIIAVIPYILPMFTSLPASTAVGGTGIIIVGGVAMETVSQLKGQLTQKSYRGFLR